MGYKNKALQRETTKIRVRRWRALQRGVTGGLTQGVTRGVTPYRGVPKMGFEQPRQVGKVDADGNLFSDD